MTTWKHIPVETLVDADALTRAQAFDLSQYVHTSHVRGLTLKWLAPSKRLLWMAAGLEYIEPELLDWIDLIPAKSAFYDLGASNGIFSIYAAKRGLDVVSIEPDPSNYFLLSWNAFLNADAEIRLAPFNVAVSDRFAAGEMYIRKMELGAHEKIVGSPTAVSGETFEAEYVHPIQLVHFDKWIDQLGLRPPEYIKIDVDGHEELALGGATESLRHCREVFIEIEDAKMNALSGMLTDAGLSLKTKCQVQNYKGLWNCVFSR